ncbi:hypothetical protein DSO57_1024722 [Entomophthora muscae]|uniref:Uncharacterized protein n=1 Tax=Entomophthora muscae TaxID=34485 RepID=A0ACC2SRQ2_9FUNG|nr:hypothetical protein DSO57_1024722 [Entomophthora muscae]
MEYAFGNSYGAPYVGNYTPPTKCLGKSLISRAVIKYHAHVKGRQFDRFGAVFIDKSEILRTTTAEPTALGIEWKFEVDITNYASLFYIPRKVTHILGNLVNDVYTGVINVDITLDLYPGEATSHQVIPLSKPDTTEPWFKINNSTTLAVQIGSLPSNIYRAELEVFLSGHDCDEFYYLNPPDSYAAPRKQCRNGPYREIQISLGGLLLGGIWPFPTIYTGGVTLSLWRPLSGLGSFVVPTATLDLAPVITLLNLNLHTPFRFQIINATDLWLLSANLHIWTKSRQPKMQLVSPYEVKINESSVVPVSTSSDDGFFETRVTKSYSLTSVSSWRASPEIREFVMSRVVQTTDFYQSLNLTQKAQSSTFNVTRLTTTTVSTSSWIEHHNSRQKIFNRPQSPKPVIRVSSYSLTGTLFSKDLGKLPGYNFKTNLSLETYEASKGVIGGLLPQGETITHIKLQADGFAISGTPNVTSVADCRSKASVRYTHSTSDSPNRHKCYVRNVKADHGYITYDQPTYDCPKPHKP